MSEDGEALYEYEVDSEALRLEKRDLDRMMAEYRNRGTREENIERNLTMLGQKGIDFERVGENHAYFSNRVDDELDISMEKIQIDLRNGKVIASIDLDNYGNVKNKVSMKYEEVNSIPVEKFRVSENFGMRDGEWTLTDRTVVNRNNIQTFIKN